MSTKEKQSSRVKNHRLTSSGFVHTPGIIPYARCAYQTGDKKTAMNIVGCYGFSEEVCTYLLENKDSTKPDPDDDTCVLFTYDPDGELKENCNVLQNGDQQ